MSSAKKKTGDETLTLAKNGYLRCDSLVRSQTTRPACASHWRQHVLRYPRSSTTDYSFTAKPALVLSSFLHTPNISVFSHPPIHRSRRCFAPVPLSLSVSLRQRQVNRNEHCQPTYHPLHFSAPVSKAAEKQGKLPRFPSHPRGNSYCVNIWHVSRCGAFVLVKPLHASAYEERGVCAQE